jgi:tetratricopeptide (TPR) repeat protein
LAQLGCPSADTGLERRGHHMNSNARKWMWSLLAMSIIAAISAVFHLTQGFSKDFARGERAFREENYPAASKYFRSAVRQRPSDKNTRAYLAATYDKLGDDEELLGQLKKLEKMDAKEIEVLVRIADLYYKHKDFANAEIYYRKALSHRKTPELQRKMAEVLAWREKYDLAIDILNEMPKTPETTEFLADVYAWNKEYEKAIERYKELLSSGEPSPEILLKLADALSAAGRDKEALGLFKKLEAMKAGESKVIVRIADLYYKLEDFANAEIYYRKALSHRKTPELQRKMAEVLAWQKKYDLAADILAEMPKTPETTQFLADVYAWNKEYEKAIIRYKELLSSEKPDPEILLKLADALRLAEKDEEAIAFYKRYLRVRNAE